MGVCDTHMVFKSESVSLLQSSVCVCVCVCVKVSKCVSTALGRWHRSHDCSDLWQWSIRRSELWGTRVRGPDVRMGPFTVYRDHTDHIHTDVNNASVSRDTHSIGAL